MELLNDILHSAIQPYLKRFQEGDYLFRQGETAETMFFLVNGRVHLIAERPSGDAVESVLESGQFLGEKVLLEETPYKRVFSACCDSDCLVLVLSRNDVLNIEANDPAVLTDLLKTILEVVGGRFEQLSFLAQGLRPANNVSRLINVMLYFSRAATKLGEEGSQFVLSEEILFKYVDMDRKEIRATLKSLISDGILVKKATNLFCISSEEALLAYAEAA